MDEIERNWGKKAIARSRKAALERSRAVALDRALLRETQDMMTPEKAHAMAKARWGRNSFASELDGLYRVGVIIGSKYVTMGEGESFDEATKNAGLPRVRQYRNGRVIADSSITGGRTRGRA